MTGSPARPPVTLMVSTTRVLCGARRASKNSSAVAVSDWNSKVIFSCDRRLFRSGSPLAVVEGAGAQLMPADVFSETTVMPQNFVLPDR